MTPAPTDLGTHAWVERTGGRLTAAERRSLLLPLARTHATNAAGRLSMLLRVNSGRRAPVTTSAPDAGLGPDPRGRGRGPAPAQPGAAEPLLPDVRVRRRPRRAARTWTWTGSCCSRPRCCTTSGCRPPCPQVDFTRASARVARDVAEQVGLSTAATDTLRTAITLHHSPGVTLAHGPVAYLLSAGAGLDVVGLRSWQLPPDLLAAVLAEYPRDGFKREFSAAFRTEATRVPDGRARFLRRYGAFDLAIKAAPFRG